MDEVVTPPPVLPPTCAVVGQTSQRQPPKTRIVRVYGLIGPEHEDCPLWEMNWLPQGDFEVSSNAARSSSCLISEHFSEAGYEQEARKLLNELQDLDRDELLAFWAQDIAGSVVKLALVIAAQEPQYRHIVDRTHAIIFFGALHRPSNIHNLDSIVFNVMEECYTGLFSHWVPSTVNKVSRHLETVNERFSFMSHMFTIISYYQASPPSPTTYTIVVPKASSTMGLENETRIGCQRAYHALGHYMSRYEEYSLQNHLVNSKTAHWNHFRHIMALLDSPYSDSTADHLELPHSVSSRMNTVSFEQSALARWVSSENTDLRTLRVMLRDQMDPVEVLVLIARSIQECTETQWNSFPAVNADNNQGKTTKADVYAQLLQQIATQQPRVFLHMHHLMPILADAIGSHSKTWRERCLWVCLKAVMHAPIGIATYGFLYINTIAAVEAVQSITSCLQYTDSRFKLVTAFANDAQLNIDASIHFNLDLKITAMDIGTVQLNPFLIPEIWSPSIIRSSLQTCGKSTCILLTWIAFAIRPLAVEDLDLILALDEGEPNRGTETIGIQHAPAAYLQKSIPEFTEISRGRIFPRVPYPDTRWVLSRLSPEHHGTAASPHFYLAQSCFSFLVTHIFKFCRVKEVDDSGVASYEIEGKSNATQNIKLEQHQQGSHKVVIDEIPAHLRGLAKYAAQNWITHYRLAMTSHQSAEHEQEALEPLLSFVKDRAYVCQWLYLVEHFSFPLYQSEGFDSIDLELVQSYLGMDTMKNLETLYQLASRSLPLSWLGRLLVHAAELGDKTIVDSLCSSLGAIEPEAISRALAATDRDIHEALRASAMSILKDEYWKTMAQAHLTAQVLGNVATSNNLLDELLNKTTWSGKEGWFSNTLDRAAEYGDERLLEKLGGTQDMKKYIASQGEELRWTPFHRVAYYGNLQCLYSLWNAGFSSSCFNILTPDGRSPLFISSSRGFGSITRFLALSDAPLNSRNGQYQQTALHAAGFYGHWKTTMTLLDEGADFTAVDSKGNFSLHLTLHQGHSHVAALTISRFDSPLHGRPLSLLNKANLEGMTVLFYAAERDLPALAKALLERGVNPDTMDYHARTPLYYAAKSGRADFIKELISHGAKTNQTFQLLRSIPLHDACYRGHADAIEALTVNVSDLLLEDSWGRTPLVQGDISKP